MKRLLALAALVLLLTPTASWAQMCVQPGGGGGGGGPTTLTGDVTGTGTGSVPTVIGASKVTSVMLVDGTIVNADISASAAIAMSKLVPLTANKCVHTDGAGVLVVSSGNCASGDTAATECSASSCNLNVATTLNSKAICLTDGTDCPAAASGDITSVYGCASGACTDVVMGATDSLDMSAIDANAAGEGLILPQATTCGGSGQAEGSVCYDKGTNALCVRNGAAAWDCETLGDATPWASITGFPTACSDGLRVSAYAAGGLTCAMPSLLAVDNICINSKFGELFHDTNCNGTKDSGEYFIDDRGAVNKILPGATSFDDITTHFPGLLPTPADVLSDNAVEIKIAGFSFPWIMVNSCTGAPAESFTVDISDYTTIDFCTAPPSGAYASAEYTELE